MNLSVMRCFFRERKELLDERSKNALIKNENILEKLHIIRWLQVKRDCYQDNLEMITELVIETFRLDT